MGSGDSASALGHSGTTMAWLHLFLVRMDDRILRSICGNAFVCRLCATFWVVSFSIPTFYISFYRISWLSKISLMKLASLFVTWILWLAVSATIILPKSRLRCSKSGAYCEQLRKALLAFASFIWFAFLFPFSFADAETLSKGPNISDFDQRFN